MTSSSASTSSQRVIPMASFVGLRVLWLINNADTTTRSHADQLALHTLATYLQDADQSFGAKVYITQDQVALIKHTCATFKPQKLDLDGQIALGTVIALVEEMEKYILSHHSSAGGAQRPAAINDADLHCHICDEAPHQLIAPQCHVTPHEAAVRRVFKEALCRSTSFARFRGQEKGDADRHYYY